MKQGENQGEIDPFACWWDIYPGKRKYNKKKCRKKFEALPLVTQREIYKDTKKRREFHKDWQNEDFICAPEVYLNQERWESPISDNVRDTTVTKDNPAQERRHLEKLRDQLIKNGSEVPESLNQEIEKLIGDSGRLSTP